MNIYLFFRAQGSAFPWQARRGSAVQIAPAWMASSWHTGGGWPCIRQALFPEQVAVRSGAGQGQHQHFILDAVDQQPIREDMTLTVSDPITGQRVILVLFGERFTHCKGGDHFLQQLVWK